MTKSMYPLTPYERDSLKYKFSLCTPAERKRLKTLIRRRNLIWIAEKFGRKPKMHNYWQFSIRRLNEIMEPKYTL